MDNSNEVGMDFVRRKKRILAAALDEIFTKDLCEYIKSDKWKNISELDKYVDNKLHEFDSTLEEFRKYYDEQLYS